ncbi:MAG: type III pantothenate kinase [Planctomycetota bacterium]|jgi:type III pantothenate kinase
MSGIILTLDLGNSAAKLLRWGAVQEFSRIEWGAAWREELEKYLQPRGAEVVETIAISSVAAAELQDEVVELCTEAGRKVVVNPDTELRIACRSTETIGRDRLFAAQGAWAERAEAAIVVDAGTALTVDALGCDGAVGVFMGGAIAPGPELLARALGTGAAKLFEIKPELSVAALGQDTPGALAAGVVVGFRGAARELVQQVASEAGLEHAAVWLTGGAAGYLKPPGLFGDRCVQHSPALVHHGLRHVALGKAR